MSAALIAAIESALRCMENEEYRYAERALRDALAAAPEQQTITLAVAEAVERCSQIVIDFPHWIGPVGKMELSEAIRATAPQAPAAAPEQASDTLCRRLQMKCTQWGTYWRAPDAHGVELTHEQALELLRDALGVEVEFKAEAQAPAAPIAQPAQTPMFWVRICSDGLYEGPIHNAQIEDVRRQSGVWSPLFLGPPATAPKRDREADRARFPDPAFNRWMDEGISDAGHTVWDSIGDVQAAHAGWESRQHYTADGIAPTQAPLTDDQRAALQIVLSHYGNDERVACLHSLAHGIGAQEQKP